ncbi:MAG: hypoxanthine phosphoribosyltransferase [Firmicutes bacterium]|jgi:hypoxanthine phosphoribosyltransferase|nr:hypoxanthine phosphoribosyltransferase [Bacillota bacterium]MBR0051200.1 hypoxanthine phosphoribosyltransferase [Bacillota bacterium]MBR0516635.1 hypoxanthine phosphoribosyltransferase [Bacillota bacterium]MBR2099619.1 hypoxanthine phosphoribosyltransferase [Bacillota bacterium]MBR3034419.1 hypoxanthine phosphoribosyltransferase [Bacillota bacterium]
MAAKKKYDFTEVLISREQLADKVAELGAKISEDYKGEELFLIGILKGSVPFMADLMRAITLDVEMDFMSVSSYGSGTKTSGVVRILKDLDSDIAGKNVLIVEDIIDSGLTLAYLKEYLAKRNPKSIKIVTMLSKPARRKADIEADYTGFVVDDKFIVGYGLDIDQKYRNLPYISWIRED